MGKYNRNDNKEEINMKSTNSSSWKYIVKLWPKINENKFWFIGDGNSVNAWSRKWIELRFKINDLNLDIPGLIQLEKVSDLLNEYGD